jgi:hypothetical protein
MNPYLSQVAPQTMQQDIYGQAPVMDTSGRAMAQNAMNQQGSQLGQQALGINKNPMKGIDPMKLGMALRQMGDPYGGTPQGGYGQQDLYMKYGSMNPQTPQMQQIMEQGGPEFASFANPMPSGG